MLNFELKEQRKKYKHLIEAHSKVKSEFASVKIVGKQELIESKFASLRKVGKQELVTREFAKVGEQELEIIRNPVQSKTGML